MTPFFTISLSCCNVAPYLDECFDSILSQSFSDWECVVWVEESGDGTPEIVRRRTAGDSRFRVFAGPKTGSCSVSRNKGIELARGEYILFADGDDLFAPDAFPCLRKRMAERPGADLYVGAALKFRHGTNEILGDIDNYPPGLDRELAGPEATLLQSGLWPNPMLQLAVFRREFLQQLGLRCIEGLRGQDMVFFPQALYRARRVVPLHIRHYRYRFRDGSVQASHKRRPGSFHGHHATIYRSLLDFYGAVSREKDFDSRVAACWARSWISRQIAYEWFSPAALDGIPRALREETLAAVFAHGFDSFDRLRRAGGVKTRLVGWWIKLFVLRPAMRGCAECFFRTWNALHHLVSRA